MFTELPALLPDAARAQELASDINDAGVVVGTSCVAADRVRHAVKRAGRQAIELTRLAPGDDEVLAAAINRQGVLVCRSGSRDPATVNAAMWDGDKAIDLNDLLDPQDRQRWRLYSAVSIDDRGQIVGLALPAGNHFFCRPFVLTPR